jgi:hypothetical protein|tara:strand:- start:244 stop:561 length:318 start_codon:yes stop_codon:yes gene_type:complete
MVDQPKPKHTQEGLPMVTQDIANLLARDLVGQNPISNEDLITRIDTENPIITKYILGTASNIQQIGVPRDVVQEAILGMLNVYELLRRQADANKLEEMYNGNSSE